MVGGNRGKSCNTFYGKTGDWRNLYFPHPKERGWIGWIQEIPEVTVEEGTREKLVNTLTSEFKRTLIECEIQAEMWDKQFEEDVKAGRLDRFAEEALQDFQERRCKEIKVTLVSI